VRAVILAGGRGTRLAPYTTVLPKPLMPIGDVPIIEIVIRQLRHFGFKRITLAVGHLGELIDAYLRSRQRSFDGVDIDFAYEDQATGTAGALRGIPGLDQTFLVMNGDILTDLDYTKLVAHHCSTGVALTIATARRRVKIDFGVIESDGKGYVRGYLEKPELSYSVSMGVYVYEPRALARVAPGGFLDFPELVQRLLKHGDRVGTYVWDGYWLDIGRPEDLHIAIEQFPQMCGGFHID
jgi:NDP-mannose synthase